MGLVGKPSAGKSTFFNAVSDSASAKVGAHPFTTLEPNQGIAFFEVKCPCVQYNVKCSPRFGSCISGTRRVPIKLLDVAGLIPGASEGRGLGNKFLDDLRHADVLLHILDVSGTTNAAGEATTEYDPSGDHAWLVEEIELWIFNNLWSKWPALAKSHAANKNQTGKTLQQQLSGYCVKLPLVVSVLEDLGVDPTGRSDLAEWTEDFVRSFVARFVQLRFRFVLVLNKADHGNCPAALKLVSSMPPDRVVMASALAECFLKKLTKKKLIRYTPGDFSVTTQDDADDLLPLDEKTKTRLDHVLDMVLLRHGSTGCQQAIQLAAGTCGLFPAFCLKSFAGLRQGEAVFKDVVLVRPGTTYKQLADSTHHDVAAQLLYVEDPSGVQLAKDEAVSPYSNVFRFVAKRE